MIICLGHLPIDPVKRDDALAAIDTLVTATRAEDGNVDYRYSVDLGDENRINIREQWENEDAMNTHMATPHLATFLEVIGGCVNGTPEVMRYDVSGSSKLF